jgi:hypothetical protein
MNPSDQEALRTLIRQTRITHALEELFIDMEEARLNEQDDLQGSDQPADIVNRKTTWLTAQRQLLRRLPEMIREASRIPETEPQPESQD